MPAPPVTIKLMPGLVVAKVWPSWPTVLVPVAKALSTAFKGAPGAAAPLGAAEVSSGSGTGLAVADCTATYNSLVLTVPLANTSLSCVVAVPEATVTDSSRPETVRDRTMFRPVI